MGNKLGLALVTSLAASAVLAAHADVVDAVPGDHPHWSTVTGGVYAATWDWSWAADTATHVKLVATGPSVTAEATLPKPATSFALQLPPGDGTAFDLTLTFTDGTNPVAAPMSARLYAVAKFEDDVRRPDRTGAWVYRGDALIPYDAAWTNAAAGVALAARNAKTGAETNMTATASWGAVPARRRDFGSDTWHLTLTFADGSTREADVRFDNAGLVVVIR